MVLLKLSRKELTIKKCETSLEHPATFAGATHLLLMGLNMRDDLKLTGKPTHH